MRRQHGSKKKSGFDPLPLNEEIFLQPWFIPRHIYLEIRKLLPNIHLMKMRHYFEDYGCLKCGDRRVIYGANGLCERCTVLIRGRVVRALKRRLKAVGAIETTADLSGRLGDGMIAAQSLLKEFGNGRAREKLARSLHGMRL
jgi:hypothetical protein